MDPNGGASLEDEMIRFARPVSQDNVRPIHPADGSGTGDVTRHKLAYEPLEYENVIKLLRKEEDRKRRESEVPTRGYRSRVIKAYLKVQVGSHGNTLKALNFEKEA